MLSEHIYHWSAELLPANVLKHSYHVSTGIHHGIKPSGVAADNLEIKL